ncbi:MAG: Npun_F0296 family exosortase-dependent surface protein [Alkalilacustris sp.]
MGMVRTLSLAGAAVALSAGIAGAATVITIHDASRNAWASTPAENRANVFAAGYGAFTPDGATWVGDGVTVITPPPASVSGTVLSPWHNSDNPTPNNTYFAVGGKTETLPNPATLAFKTLQSSFTLLWGSIDEYNQIDFAGEANSGAGEIVRTVTGSDILGAIGSWATLNDLNDPCDATGANRNCNALVTLRFSDDFKFSSASFLSTTGQQAFEFATVPLPAPALLLLTGIGALGGLAAKRRRREAKA